MSKNMYLNVALPTPLRRLFDYLAPTDIDPDCLVPGVRILVPFQTRKLIGILVSTATESTIATKKLKPAISVLDASPILPADVYELCEWAADYYQSSLGEVLMCALPAALRKDKVINRKPFKSIIPKESDSPPILNSDQQFAVDAIIANQFQFKSFLLDGVTGSGKTEVYLRSMEVFLSAGQQVLVLVPEINLTPQTIARFKKRFKLPIATLHSNLSESVRLRHWEAAKTGEAQIIIGTRSAVYTPFKNLGLIIVDEEHDQSFKQQDRFRYHARDLAVMRARINNIPIVLGSATPSLESLHNAKLSRYTLLPLHERAGNAELPTLKILNLQSSNSVEGLSSTLIDLIRLHLKEKNQVMLFLNRRGFAPVLYCVSCGWIAECQRCDARMVYHHSPLRLRCHHCSATGKIPTVCKKCKDTNLQAVGLGTQRLEQILANLFSDVPIIRIDRDNTRRKGAMDKLLTQINEEKSAILLGTQMLAKGHHFPNVTLVGIVDVDSGFFSADFRAAEQMGQLILQVSGRAGREEKPGTVVIQTRHPNHPLLQTLIHHGYNQFAESLLTERNHAQLPPFAFLAMLKAEATAELTAQKFLLAIKNNFTDSADVVCLGPVSALMAKRKGLYSQHLIFRAHKRSHLHQAVTKIVADLESKQKSHRVKWSLDIDPIEI